MSGKIDFLLTTGMMQFHLLADTRPSQKDRPPMIDICLGAPMLFDCNILCILAHLTLHANLPDSYLQNLEEVAGTDHLEKPTPHRI